MRSSLTSHALRWPLVALLLAGCSPQPSTSQPSGGHSASATVKPPELPEVAADPREAILAEAALTLLSRQHVLKKPIDDAFSEQAFGKLIEELDSGKVLLLERDVDALAAFKTTMDDQLKEGNLRLGRQGVAMVNARRTLVKAMIAEILSKPLDFNTNETIETDPKKRVFCKSDDELRERWRGVLKLQMLERMQHLEEILEAKNKPADSAKKSTDPDEAKRQAAAEKALGEIPTTFEGREEKVRKELATRFETQFTRMASREKLEPVSDFLNAVNAVFDPHTSYMPPAEEANFDIAMTGKLEGIGATLAEQDHYIVVHDLVPGGASWQQGKLEIGDLILAVAQEGKEAVDVTDMPIDKVVSMIRGPKGTVVVLTLKKSDGRIETLSITRDIVRIEATFARGAVLKPSKSKESVGYIFLPGFYGDMQRGKPGERNATSDVREILQNLQKRKVSSVILDLRGNGGGLLSHARDISGLFIEKGPVVQTRDSDGQIEVLADTDPSVSFGGDVVVLVDRFSASAAEILAGALQDYERAVVVGTSATHGKGTVQAVIDLDRMGGRAGEPLGLYKVTVQEYFRVSGGSTQLKGVTPDILLPDPASFIDSGERTLYHAIPWSTIKPAPIHKSMHAWQITQLQSASNSRTSANADLDAVRKFGKLLGERKDRTVEPLERKTWQEQKKREKSELDALDPKQKDKKPLMEVEALGDSIAATDAKVKSRLTVWKDNLARDLWVEECTHILQDMRKK